MASSAAELKIKCASQGPPWKSYGNFVSMGLRLCALVLLLSFAVPAAAYIDPASGSAIMSAIIGAFVAMGLAIKTYWYKLTSLFSSKPSATPEPQNPDTDQPDAKSRG